MKTWFSAAITRAIKTMAQTSIASIGASAILSDVNWTVVLSASVLAGILSLLTSIAGLPEVDGTGAFNLDAVNTDLTNTKGE